MTKRLFVGFSSQDAKGSNKIYDIKLVNHDLLNHFNTRKGERRMLPEFGTTIWNKLFEPFTPSLRDDIIEEATAVIAADSRVSLVKIEVTETSNGLKIEMTLNYQPYKVVSGFSVEFDKRMAARS